MPTRLGAIKRRYFLEHLVLTGNVSEAAERCGISRAQLYRTVQADDCFRREWAAALDEAADRLRAVAFRRAVEGVPRPVAARGQVVYDNNLQPLVSRRYSDTLLMHLIESHDRSLARRHLMGDEARRARLNAADTATRVLESTPVVPEAPSTLALAKART